MRSLRYYIYKFLLKTIAKRPLVTLKALHLARAQADTPARTATLPKDVEVTPVLLGTTPAEIYTPMHLRSHHSLFYIRGGGFCMGSLDAYRAFLVQLARGLGMRIITPAYSLAPEHPFPTGLNQVFEAYHWCIREDKSAGEIVIAGDSAGANLALSVMVMAREGNITLPAAAILSSPWVDLTLRGDSLTRNKRSEHYLHADSASSFAGWYLKDNTPETPLASPVFASLHGLPPLFIQYSDTELIADDSLSLIKKAKEDGVSVTISALDDFPHAALIFYPVVKESRAVFGAVDEFLVNARILSISLKNTDSSKRMIKR